MGANDTSFKEGNKDAEKWTKDNVTELLTEMYNNADTDNNILCFSDACKSVGYRDSHIDYLIKKFPVFEDFKRDIQKAVVRRINKGAILGDFNPTSCIWRMKQLGEVDQSNQNINMTGNINIPISKWIEGFEDK